MDENKTVEVQETEEKKGFGTKVKAFFGRAGKFCVDHVGDVAKFGAGVLGGLALGRLVGGDHMVDEYYGEVDEGEIEADTDDSVEN